MSRTKNSVINNLLLTVAFLVLLTGCIDKRNNSQDPTKPVSNTPKPLVTDFSPKNFQINVNIFKSITVDFNTNIYATNDNVALLQYQSVDPTNFSETATLAGRVKVTTTVVNSKLIISPVPGSNPGFVEYTGNSRYKLLLNGITDVIYNPIKVFAWEFATAVDSVSSPTDPKITRFTLEPSSAAVNPGQANSATLTAVFKNGTGIISSVGNPDIDVGTASSKTQTFTVKVSPTVNTKYTLNVINSDNISAQPKTVVYNLAGQFAFELLSTDIKETAGVVTLRVLRLGGTRGAVSVQYQTINNGSATANSDYVSVPQPSSANLPTLVFPDKSAVSQVFEIIITNDQLVNELPTEFFSVSLLNPQGGASINADMKTHQVNIINDDILSVNYGIKQLKFSWSKYPGAIYYNLLEQTNGQGFKVISVIDVNSVPALSKNINISVHKYDWLNSSYMLEACDSSNVCVSSNVVSTANQSRLSIGLLKPSNLDNFDAFGHAIVLSANGQVLVVSAIAESSAKSGIINSITGDVFPTVSTDDDSAPNAGAVYVFNRSQDKTGVYSWLQTAYIKASNPEISDLFGFRIALSDDGKTLAVSANQEASNQRAVVNKRNGVAIFPTIRSDDNSVGTGAVYIFKNQVDGWVQQAYIKSSDIAVNDFFGSALALSGDGTSLAVGAFGKTIGAVLNVGQVYLFKKSNLGWTENTVFKANKAQANMLYGGAVALNQTGDTLAIGASGEADYTGAVYYYRKMINPTSTWSLKSYLKASNALTFSAFGVSVALSDDGDTLAVGAATELSSATGVLNKIAAPLPVPPTNVLGQGAVYVFGRSTVLNSNNFLEQYSYIKASNPDLDDRFGEEIALSGDGLTLAVTANYESSFGFGVPSTGFPTLATDANTISAAGAVYLYTRPLLNTKWSQKAFIKASDTKVYNFFGNSVSMAGEIQQTNGQMLNNGSSLAIGSSAGAFLY